MKYAFLYEVCQLGKLISLSPRLPPPSSRNVKFQNDPLIVLLTAVSRANRPGPKHALRIILLNGY